ncbi:MAG: hypothetical protein ACLP5H_22955 [Desulfomonilaceae bacterium]
MSTKIDRAEPEGPELQSSLLLQFLIKRFSEALSSDSPKVPFLLQGMGLAGLGGDEELLLNYKGLLASSILPPKEIIRRSVELFQVALARDPDTSSFQDSREQTEEDRPLNEKASRHVMMVALREAKIMIEQSDYRHSKIVEMLGWIGLQIDPEWLAEFEQVRSSFADDPEEMIERGRDILRDALFRRRPSGRVRTSSD